MRPWNTSHDHPTSVEYFSPSTCTRPPWNTSHLRSYARASVYKNRLSQWSWCEISSLLSKRSGFEKIILAAISLWISITCRMASPSPSSSSKRSVEARRRRSQKKKTKARENARLSPYLLPQPCASDVHKSDCVAIDCEMLQVHSRDPAQKMALASVAIVNSDLECVYEAFVQPPTDRKISKKGRVYCPVTDQQFDIARCGSGTTFPDVQREVLAILQRWVISCYQSAIFL